MKNRLKINLYFLMTFVVLTANIIVVNATTIDSNDETDVAVTNLDNSNEATDSKVKSSPVSDYSKGDFLIGDVYYVVSERFSSEDVPAGFSEVTVTIHEHTYKAIKKDEVTLIYLKDKSNTQGDGMFYQYLADEDLVTTFETISANDITLVLETPEEVLNHLTSVSARLKGNQLNVYKLEEDTGFFYMYGTNQDGETAWYCYDSNDEVLQKVNTELFDLANAPVVPSSEYQQNEIEQPVEEPESVDEGFDFHISIPDNWYMYAGGALVVLIIIIIIAGISAVKKNKRLDDEIWASENNKKTKSIFDDLDSEGEIKPATKMPKFDDMESDPLSAASSNKKDDNKVEKSANTNIENTNKASESDEEDNDFLEAFAKASEETDKIDSGKLDSLPNLEILDLNDL